MGEFQMIRPQRDTLIVQIEGVVSLDGQRQMIRVPVQRIIQSQAYEAQQVALNEGTVDTEEDLLIAAEVDRDTSRPAPSADTQWEKWGVKFQDLSTVLSQELNGVNVSKRVAGTGLRGALQRYRKVHPAAVPAIIAKPRRAHEIDRRGRPSTFILLSHLPEILANLPTSVVLRTDMLRMYNQIYLSISMWLARMDRDRKETALIAFLHDLGNRTAQLARSSSEEFSYLHRAFVAQKHENEILKTRVAALEERMSAVDLILRQGGLKMLSSMSGASMGPMYAWQHASDTTFLDELDIAVDEADEDIIEEETAREAAAAAAVRIKRERGAEGGGEGKKHKRKRRRRTRTGIE